MIIRKLTLTVIVLVVVFVSKKSPVWAQKIYWPDAGSGKIKQAHLDGSDVEDLITVNLGAESGIAVDAINGKIYWANSSADKIQRADLDGSNVEDLLDGKTTQTGAWHVGHNQIPTYPTLIQGYSQKQKDKLASIAVSRI